MIEYDQKMNRYQQIWYLPKGGSVRAVTYVRKLGFERSALVVIRDNGKDEIMHRSLLFLTADEANNAKQGEDPK